ncbi:DUF5695 domain-containing protein [Maribacter algicola]|nr:DUF5695 domain-containing protein [Maribacter algicola]
MNKMHTKFWLLTGLVLIVSCKLSAQKSYWSNVEHREPTLGVAEVFQKHNTPEFQLKLVKASQTVAALRPMDELSFDYTPGERLEVRDKDSLYHLGDINLRIKTSSGHWKTYSTASNRAPVTPLAIKDSVLAAADLANTLPKDIPVSIKRFYELDKGQLVMRFEITNMQDTPIEIGALGVPMIFNNILEGKSLTEAHKQNVFFDPYIGKDAGYLEVKRLSGKGPALLVIPKEHMAFEAYRPLLDDPTRKSIVFEGFHEWMAHSKAYAENEWQGVEQWNKPTSVVLQPNTTKNYSLKFVLSKGVKHIQETLIKEERPVVVGVPGYVIPMDVKAHLYVNYKSEIKSFDVYPKNALKIKEDGTTTTGLKKYLVSGKKWGRARLTISYNNGVEQTVNYKVIKPEAEVIKDFGNFLTTEQWYDNPNDPFGRSPSPISYDYEKKEQVTQDGRVWISGLSDEGGAGSWLAAIMKQLVQPNRTEIQKLQEFIDHVLWGNIQYSEGPYKYGVKKSLFYYEPDSLPKGTYDKNIDYTTWAAWDHKHANDRGRSFNYPHVAASYWVMYRLARYHNGLVDNKNWDWYLKNAYHTTIAMMEQAPYYAQFGQMEGSVFLSILKDLQNENYDEMATDLEARMKERADHWKALDYPFGSEMPWDSTGQEEVYTWTDYFGYEHKANITLNAILAYMPTMPHWAYNGNARRYWDFLYGGKAGETSRVERQIHHYGSGINAIPVLKQYRKTPDFYLLKVGYGGLMGSISNITQDGFGPAAFHSYPSSLKIDGISGDYGSGFYGYAVNSATYITNNDELGWLAFGGNVSQKGTAIEVIPTTAAKSKIYLTPKKLWMTLDAGSINKITYDTSTEKVTLVLDPKTEHTPKAYLRIDDSIVLPYKKVRGAYEIELDDTVKEITL